MNANAGVISSRSSRGPGECRVLLTGFEPFGPWTRNPSGELARRLDGRVVGGCRVTGRVLPVKFAEIGSSIEHHVRLTRPGAVICTGIASQLEIRVECSARNWVATGPDKPYAGGTRVIGQPLVVGGPERYASTLPVAHLVEVLRRDGLPARASADAGTFACNQVFYHLMHLLASDPPDQPRRVGGFVHLPALFLGPEVLDRAFRVLLSALAGRFMGEGED